MKLITNNLKKKNIKFLLPAEVDLNRLVSNYIDDLLAYNIRYRSASVDNESRQRRSVASLLLMR